MTESVLALAWAERIQAAGLAVVSGLDAEARLREITGDPVEEAHDDFGGAEIKGWRRRPARMPIQFDAAPGGEVLIEPNGYLMSVYACEMTRNGGSLISVYWCTPIGQAAVIYARDGRIMRTFYCYDEQGGEGDPQPEEAGLPWETSPTAAMVALFERAARLPVTEEWLMRTPRRTWFVLEPPRV